jgi:hypothetical protein
MWGLAQLVRVSMALDNASGVRAEKMGGESPRRQ